MGTLSSVNSGTDCCVTIIVDLNSSSLFCILETRILLNNVCYLLTY